MRFEISLLIIVSRGNAALHKGKETEVQEVVEGRECHGRKYT